MEIENTITYDKRIALNSRMQTNDILVYGNLRCYCTKCGAEFSGYLQGPLSKNDDISTDYGKQKRISIAYDRYENRQKNKERKRDYKENLIPWDPKEELYTAALGSSCPICGNPFREGREYDGDNCYGDKIDTCYWTYGNSYAPMNDVLFQNKAKARQKRLQESSEQKISQIVMSGASAATVFSAKTDTIKSNPEKLKEYIFQLIQLEGNIYALKKRLHDLYFQKSENERYLIFCENIHNKPMAQVPYLEKQISMYGIIIAELKERQEWRKENYSKDRPKEPSKPQLLHVGALDFIIGNADKNKKLMAEYEQQITNYRNELAKYNAEKEEYVSAFAEQISTTQGKIDTLKAEIIERNALVKILAERKLPSPALVIKSMLDKEIQQAEESLYNLASAREQLYGFNIIFGKYRDVVALSTFYEYLMAGRCTTLEGANGAYNLYEAESRANLIITKLDDVLLRLDKIIDNQYTISRMMSNINDQLNILNETMGKAEKSLTQISQNTARIAENSEVIAHNTAVNAYYSKVNAELTNSMGYLMAYKL